MRIASFLLLSLVSASTLAYAAPLPVGSYTLSAVPGSGIHASPDTGTLSGSITFDSASNVTFADLVFNDTTTNMSYLFSGVGATTIDTAGHTLGATITDLAMPNDYYAFSVRLPGLANGGFTLNCGTDCDTDVVIPGQNGFLNEEFVGSIVPTPEPTSLVLLGTGVLGLAGALRRRFSRS